jgi:hypothetical protein
MGRAAKYTLLVTIPVMILGLYVALVVVTGNIPPGTIVEPGSPSAHPVSLR